jgi:hypothetical protein
MISSCDNLEKAEGKEADERIDRAFNIPLCLALRACADLVGSDTLHDSRIAWGWLY